MKKVSTGGKIIGVLEILIAIGLIAIFVVGYRDVRMERFMEDRATTFPVLGLLAGGFKLLGVIMIWIKQKIGVGFYSIGNLVLIFFIFTLSGDLNSSDELIPLLILYAGIALQIWFGFIMYKAIKVVNN